MRELAGFHTFGALVERAGAGARRARRRDRADRRCRGLLHAGGGSDAVDTAGKIARRYWYAVGKPEQAGSSQPRARLPRHERATARASAGSPPTWRATATLVGDVEHVPGTTPTRSAPRSTRVGAERVAAFIGEPVIGAGGVIPPPDGYWPRVAAVCREHDVLLDRRRGHHRLRPTRHLVRRRALRRRARPDDLREGPHVRLHPAGRA